MRRHDVHVFPNVRYDGWKVTQGKRILTRSRPWKSAMQVGIRRARRDHIELVAHSRNGKIRSKDSYGNESPTRDTEH